MKMVNKEHLTRTVNKNSNNITVMKLKSRELHF